MARSRCFKKEVRLVGDPTKFGYLWEYYAFHIAFACLLLSELFIFFYTMRRGPRAQTAKGDHGTKWLLYGNFAVCLFVSIYSVSQAAPALPRQLVFPPFAADIGTAFVAAGIVIRLSAVLTLKKAFTLHVQTAAGQRLVTSGLYHTVRHPAYSGSILSLFGVALAFRNIAAVCLVPFCCLICYGTRIQVEEKALEARFGKEYVDYKRGTYRLFPYIF